MMRNGNQRGSKKRSRNFPWGIRRSTRLGCRVGRFRGGFYVAISPYGRTGPRLWGFSYISADSGSAPKHGSFSCSPEGPSDEWTRNSSCIHAAADSPPCDRDCIFAPYMVLSGDDDHAWGALSAIHLSIRHVAVRRSVWSAANERDPDRYVSAGSSQLWRVADGGSASCICVGGATYCTCRRASGRAE